MTSERVLRIEGEHVEGVDYSAREYDNILVRDSTLVRCTFNGVTVDSFSFGAGSTPSRFLGCTFDRIKAKLFQTGFVRFELCQFTHARVGDWHGDYAEVVDCVFSGQFRSGVFSGRPIAPLVELELRAQFVDAELAESPTFKAMLFRERNEFHGNDFSAADLNIEFRHGIDLARQVLPAGEDYVFLPDGRRAVEVGRAFVATLSDAKAKAKASTAVEIWSDHVAEGQEQLLMRRRWYKSMAAEADLLFEELRRHDLCY